MPARRCDLIVRSFVFACWVAGLTVFNSGTDAQAAVSAYLPNSFTDLGSLGAPSSDPGTWPHAISESGQIVGRGTLANNRYAAFRWDAGSIAPIGSLGYESEATAVNDFGLSVGGWHETSNSPTIAVSYFNGQMTSLQSYAGFAGSSANARGVSNPVNGVPYVVGVVQVAQSGFSGALWRNNALTVISTMQSAAGVNDSGVVVGSMGNGLQQNAIRYNAGQSSVLYAGSAYAINNAGAVVGYKTFPSAPNDEAACIYKNGVLTQIGPAGRLNLALALNDLDMVVGRYQPTVNVDHGFVWLDGTFTDLNSLVALPAGWTIMTAEGVNNAGQVTGLYSKTGGFIGGYVLTIVPEPGMAGMFGAGIACALRRRRRAM